MSCTENLCDDCMIKSYLDGLWIEIKRETKHGQQKKKTIEMVQIKNLLSSQQVHDDWP